MRVIFSLRLTAAGGSGNKKSMQFMQCQQPEMTKWVPHYRFWILLVLRRVLLQLFSPIVLVTLKAKCHPDQRGCEAMSQVPTAFGINFILEGPSG